MAGDGEVVFNDRTEAAIAQVRERTDAKFREFLENIVALVKTPGEPAVPRDKWLNPTVKGWEYTSGGYQQKTGALAESVAYEIGPDGEYSVFTQCGYGAYIELGTARIVANPAIARAIDTASVDFANSGWDD